MELKYTARKDANLLCIKDSRNLLQLYCTKTFDCLYMCYDPTLQKPLLQDTN